MKKEIPFKSFGEILKIQLKKKQITSAKLCALSDIEQSRMSVILNRDQNVTVHTHNKIIAALGMKRDEFYAGH